MRDSIRADAARPRASTARRAPQLSATRGVDRLATAAQDGPLPDTLDRLLAPGAGALRGPVSRALQQTHGNRAVTRMVQAANARAQVEHATPAGIEARRAMGDADAHHERQADRAADAAMRRLGSAPPPPAEPAAPPPPGGLGRPLSFPIRRRFEDAFGWDFSDVRLHIGAAAAQAAERLGAKAVTSGRDIVLGGRVGDPEAASNLPLLAHELAHVIQQDKAASRSLPGDGPAKGSVAASLGSAPSGLVQGAPLVTAVVTPGELGVGRQITATATVAAGAGALRWSIVPPIPAGVTVTGAGRTATVRSAAAPNPHPVAGAPFTVQAERAAAGGDNATVAVMLVGITGITGTPVPAFANQPIAGGTAPAPAVPVLPALGGVADPNRGGLVGNTANVVVVTAPAGRATTITLPVSLGAAIAGTVITPGSTTGNARVRVTDNATLTRLDAPLVVQPVPLFLASFGALGAAPPGTYGALYPLNFRSSDTTGVLNRVVGETITEGGRDDLGVPLNVGGANPAPIGALAVPGNAWTDQVLTAIGAVAGAAGDANPVNVNRFVGPGVAVPLPAVQALRQGFHFQGWAGAWSDEFDHGLHVRTLGGRPGAFTFRSSFPFSRAKGPVQPDPYAGPPLIVLTAITLNAAAAPAAPLAAGGLAADGVAVGGVTVTSSVAGRLVNWSVISGPVAFTAGAAGVAPAAPATLQAGLVAGNVTLRAADTVFPNRRVDGNVRLVAVRLRGMTTPVATVPAGTLTAVVNVNADPGGRAVVWTVDGRAAAAGVTVAGAPVAGPAAAAAARTATVTRPAAFTGRVTVTAADTVRPAVRASTVITFR
jgi:hypothetical protein